MQIGIRNELLTLLPAEDQPAGQELLSQVFRRYCNSQQYLAAVAAAGAMRHDLDGHPVEPVVEPHKTKWVRAKRSRGRSPAAASAALAVGAVDLPNRSAQEL